MKLPSMEAPAIANVIRLEDKAISFPAFLLSNKSSNIATHTTKIEALPNPWKKRATIKTLIDSVIQHRTLVMAKMSVPNRSVGGLP